MDSRKTQFAFLIAGTVIGLPDGTTIPIEKIKVATKVATHSGHTATVTGLVTKRVSGTVLDIGVLGPFEHIHLSPKQLVGFFPYIDNPEAPTRLNMILSPIGDLDFGDKILMPWIAANKTSFFDKVLKPLQDAVSGLLVPSVAVQSCADGLIVPITDIYIREAVQEKAYSLTVAGEGSFIANGVAVFN